MLVSLKRVSRVLVVPILGIFAGSLFVWPAQAQTPPPGAAAPGKKAVLFVPIQRSEFVAESVPPRLEEYLRALIEIDPAIRLVTLPPEAWRTPEEIAPTPSPEPVRENPVLKRASQQAESGRAEIRKRRFESGLMKLMDAEKLYRAQLAELEDFDQYVDVLVWIAVGLVLGGFREEAGPALRNLLTVRPEIVLPVSEFDPQFVSAVERARGRLVGGGSIAVQVNDEGASVYVDGRLVGQGNQMVQDLVQGRHFVRVTLPGMRPQGRFITVGKTTATVSFQFKHDRPKEVARRPAKPLTEYARTGEYSPAFVEDAREAVRKAMADFAVLGYVARSDTAFHIGLFLFEAAGGRLAAIKPAVVDTDLSNLQLALLELESRLSRAVEKFPDEHVVRTRPPLYAIVPTQRPVAAPAPVHVPAATPAPVTTPAPTPVTAVTPSPVPSGVFEDIPPDFPMETLPGREPSKPWYGKWWVWSAIGGAAAVALGVGLGVSLGKGGAGGEKTFGANVRW